MCVRSNIISEMFLDNLGCKRSKNISVWLGLGFTGFSVDWQVTDGWVPLIPRVQVYALDNGSNSICVQSDSPTQLHFNNYSLPLYHHSAWHEITAQHSTAPQHSTAQHSTAQHSPFLPPFFLSFPPLTAQHSTALPPSPVIIHAPVLLAAFMRPLLNTSFSRGLSTKLLAPPVTEITRFGISRLHLFSIKSKILLAFVSCESRMYCK